MNVRALRQLFPPVWVCVLYTAFLALFLSLTPLLRVPDGNVELQRLWSGLFVAIVIVWSTLLGRQTCMTAACMLPLRLPQLGATLRNAAGVHLALGIGLPALVVLLWQPAPDHAVAAVTTLWLGVTAGVLILSLPAPLAFLPALVLILGWHGFDEAAVKLAAGCSALLLAGLSWHWHSSRLRSRMLAPFGAWTPGRSPRPSLQLQPDRPEIDSPSRQGASAQAEPVQYGRDLLAAVLGRWCQTSRQACGRRGQRLIWLLAATGTAGLLAIGRSWHMPDWGAGMMSVLAISLPVVIDQPQQILAKLRSKQHAQWAELFLAPGLPPQPHLEGAVMRQVFLCLRERVLLFALILPAALQLGYSLSPWWALWWLCFAASTLLGGLYMAWLSWHGQKQGVSWEILLTLALFGLAYGTNHGLLVHRTPFAFPELFALLALGWAILLAVMLARFLIVRRRIGARQAHP